MDNRTEQFLEIALPEGARLWAAHVADQPVKPILGQNSIRIPLVKTAEGDRDYAVTLKYGGRMEGLGPYHHVEFPLIRSVKIQIEESQVRLWLPTTHRWFAFEGTMGLAAQEGDLMAGYLKYKNQQILSASEGLDQRESLYAVTCPVEPLSNGKRHAATAGSPAGSLRPRQSTASNGIGTESQCLARPSGN